MGPQIIDQVKTVLAERFLKFRILGSEYRMSPPWTKDMMSRYAKIALGVSLT